MKKRFAAPLWKFLLKSILQQKTDGQSLHIRSRPRLSDGSPDVRSPWGRQNEHKQFSLGTVEIIGQRDERHVHRDVFEREIEGDTRDLNPLLFFRKLMR